MTARLPVRPSLRPAPANPSRLLALEWQKLPEGRRNWRGWRWWPCRIWPAVLVERLPVRGEA